MPRTFGRNQIHVSQVVGWVEADCPLVEVAPAPPDRARRPRSPRFVAERIPDGATIQTGIGAIPNAILAALGDHRDLGVHTELISDGVMDLVERGVVTGVAKQLNRTKTVGTFALGTRRLYDFLDENTAFELWPVRYVNDPRVIATGARTSCRSTPRSPSTSSASAPRRRSTAPTTRRAAARPTSPAARCTRRAGRASSCCTRPPSDGDLQDRRPARRRRRRHDAQEHRRQGRHRVGRRRAARPLDPRASRGADRHRPPDHRDRLAHDARRARLPLNGRDRWPYRRPFRTAHHRGVESARPEPQPLTPAECLELLAACSVGPDRCRARGIPGGAPGQLRAVGDWTGHR